MRFLVGGDEPVAARHRGDFRGPGDGLGLVLVAEFVHRRGGGADELEVVLPAHLGELRVLGKEAVTGVDGLGFEAFRGRDDARRVEVALGWGGGPDADGFVRELEIGGAAVGFRVHHGDFDPKVPARPDHPQGDLAAIGYQDLAEH